jgi:hypothetical protein
MTTRPARQQCGASISPGQTQGRNKGEFAMRLSRNQMWSKGGGAFRRMAATLAGMSLLSLPANAAEITVPQCPEDVPVRQTFIAPVLTDGWKAVNDEGTYPQPRYKIFLSRGEYPAKEAVLLTPTDEKEEPFMDRRKRIAYYDALPPGADGARDYWMVCDYAGASVALVRKLPKNAARCVVRYSPRPFSSDPVSLRCFDKARKKPRPRNKPRPSSAAGRP